MIYVTITGADDSVGTVSLGHMAQQWPWVEWGILVSTTRMGSPRYPSAAWLAELARMEINASVHLCGKLTDEPVRGSLVAALGGFRRVQVNGYQLGTAKAWVDAFARVRTRLILQARSYDDLGIVLLDAGRERLVGACPDVLFDPSMGRGTPVARWPEMPTPPGVRLGFAGGINPDNVERVCEQVAATAAHAAKDTWIDMESGVRTEDDRFDWNRVTAVLETVKAFNGRRR